MKRAGTMAVAAIQEVKSYRTSVPSRSSDFFHMSAVKKKDLSLTGASRVKMLTSSTTPTLACCGRGVFSARRGRADMTNPQITFRIV